jgi:hypothetical protein
MKAQIRMLYDWRREFMQNDRLNPQDRNVQALTALTQQLLTTLEDTLQYSYKSNSTAFRRILLSLPQEYQSLGMVQTSLTV